MSSPGPLESTRFCIMLALAKEPLYGAAIQQQIATDSRTGLYLQPTTVYKTLKRLESLKLVESSWEAYTKRTFYRLTATGQRLLHAEAVRLQDAGHLAQQRLGR